MSPINQLRALVSALDAGRPVPTEVAAPFVWAVQRYLAHAADGMNLDGALGLAAQGRPAWWVVERRAKRDAALRALGALVEAPSVAARARSIATVIENYRRSADWRRDRYASAPPANLTPSQAAAWTVLKNDPVPEHRQLVTILANAPIV